MLAHCTVPLHLSSTYDTTSYISTDRLDRSSSVLSLFLSVLSLFVTTAEVCSILS